jgi:phage/plasmid-associated DNA primase
LGCNALPPTSDTTRGFRRRVAVLQFTSVIEDSEINRNLKNDLIDEMPVLVPYCLEQLSKAIVRNALTIPASSDALVDNWLKMSAPVEEFYDEHLRPLDDAERLNPKLWTQARTIYEAYTRWATATGHKGYSETTFGEWLKAKLGIPLEECGRAPYKRADGRYYPLTFTDSARAEAAHREAARPATTTPEEEAELQRVIDDAAHQATEALKIANGRAN